MRPARKSKSRRSNCRSLTLIDASESRRREQARYLETQSTLSDLLAKIRAFEERDCPAFHRWLATDLADGFRKRDKLASLLKNLQMVVMNVESYAAIKRISQRAAYEKLEKMQKNGENPSDEDIDDLFQHEYDEEDLYGRSEQPPSPEKRSGREPESVEDPQLKSIYRQLVRKLHPDANSDLSDRAKGQWFEVQDAYQWKDLERLKGLLTELSLDSESSNQSGPSVSLGELIALRQGVEKRIKKVNSKIRNFKKDPAWDFSSVVNNPYRLEILRNLAGDEIEEEIEFLEAEALPLAELVARWTKPIKPRRKRKPERRISAEGQLEFD
jgi:hypothetical protein